MSERDDLAGLVRIAASAWLRTGEWALQTYVKAGRRVLGVVMAPETAVDLAEDVRAAARDATGRGDHDRPAAGSAAAANGGESDEQRVAAEEWALLRGRGAEILRLSRDVNYEEVAHPAYERILGEIAPDEARILRLLLLSGPQPAVDVRTGGPIGLLSSRLIAPGFSMLGARAGCRYSDRVPGYLNNLFRLGMIWFSRETIRDPVRYQVLEAQPEVLTAIKSVRMAKVVRRSIHLTPFGEDFCRVCLALDSRELVDLPEHGAPPVERSTTSSPPLDQ